MNTDNHGAMTPVDLWSLILDGTGDGKLFVIEHEDGHPKTIHETYGANEIPSFMGHLVAKLKEHSPKGVYRVGSCSFVTLEPIPSSLCEIQYKDLNMKFSIREFNYSI